MKTKELSKNLKMAIENKQPLNIWLGDIKMGIYKFKNNIYQGEIGYFELDDLLDGINNGWVKAEVAK